MFSSNKLSWSASYCNPQSVYFCPRSTATTWRVKVAGCRCRLGLADLWESQLIASVHCWALTQWDRGLMTSTVSVNGWSEVSRIPTMGPRSQETCNRMFTGEDVLSLPTTRYPTSTSTSPDTSLLASLFPSVRISMCYTLLPTVVISTGHLHCRCSTPLRTPSSVDRVSTQTFESNSRLFHACSRLNCCFFEVQKFNNLKTRFRLKRGLRFIYLFYFYIAIYFKVVLNASFEPRSTSCAPDLQGLPKDCERLASI